MYIVTLVSKLINEKESLKYLYDVYYAETESTLIELVNSLKSFIVSDDNTDYIKEQHNLFFNRLNESYLSNSNVKILHSTIFDDNQIIIEKLIIENEMITNSYDYVFDRKTNDEFNKLKYINEKSFSNKYLIREIQPEHFSDLINEDTSSSYSGIYYASIDYLKSKSKILNKLSDLYYIKGHIYKTNYGIHIELKDILKLDNENVCLCSNDGNKKMLIHLHNLFKM